MESLRLKICIFMLDQSAPTASNIKEFLDRQRTRPILTRSVMSHLKKMEASMCLGCVRLIYMCVSIRVCVHVFTYDKTTLKQL